MLCFICYEDISLGDKIKCSQCNELSHFNCVGLREEKFRNMSASVKNKWPCNYCKINKLKPVNTAVLSNNTKTSDFNNATLNDLVESIKFMSNQFDNYGQQ